MEKLTKIVGLIFLCLSPVILERERGRVRVGKNIFLSIFLRVVGVHDDVDNDYDEKRIQKRRAPGERVLPVANFRRLCPATKKIIKVRVTIQLPRARRESGRIRIETVGWGDKRRKLVRRFSREAELNPRGRRNFFAVGKRPDCQPTSQPATFPANALGERLGNSPS